MTRNNLLPIITALTTGVALTSCNSQEKTNLLIGGVAVIAVISYITYRIYRSRLRKKEEELRRLLKEHRREYYDRWMSEYKAASGEPDIVFTNDDLDLDHILIFNTDAGSIFINGHHHPYSEILDYKIEDKQVIIPGKVTEVTTSSTSTVFKRALIGSMLAKDSGALIGALTAPRETHRYVDEDIIIHNYVLSINFNNVGCPYVRYEIGENEEMAENIGARLNIILERNKSR